MRSPNGSAFYYTDATFGFCIVDISASDGLYNPVSQCVETPGFASGITIAPDGDKLYISDRDSGMIVYDSTNPLSPVAIETVATDGSTYQVNVSSNGQQIFVADGIGVKVFTVEEDAVSLQANLSLSGVSYAVMPALDGSLAFLATGDDGLQVVRFEQETYQPGDELSQEGFMRAISLSMMATTALLRLAFQMVSYPVMSHLLMLHLRPSLKVIMDGLTRMGYQASLL